MILSLYNVTNAIAKVAVWLSVVGVCVAFWWVVLDRYGFYAIGVFLLCVAIWILQMAWTELSQMRKTAR